MATDCSQAQCMYTFNGTTWDKVLDCTDFGVSTCVCVGDPPVNPMTEGDSSQPDPSDTSSATTPVDGDHWITPCAMSRPGRKAP
jgi:hypothetical protein